MHRFLALLIFSCIAALTAFSQQRQFTIEGTGGKWFVDAERRVGDVRLAEYLGRKDAVWLKANSHVMHDDGRRFVDGEIEFDVAPMKGGHFFALLFRRGSFRDFDNIYFRAHKSGKYNALQYAPAINGSSTWQLYPEFNRTINFPREKWTHVRVEVRGTTAKVFLNRSEKPTLVVDRLRSDANGGYVAVWARINNKREAWAAAISNFKVTHWNRNASSKSTRIEAPAGILSKWKVSKQFENKEGPVSSLPKITEWRETTAEESGLINLNRAVGSPRGRYTAYAKTTIESTTSKRVTLDFGYSDDVTIFLNGKPIFSGVNGWEARYPESMGFVKLGNARTYLELKQGKNELVFAVTNQRFGWGFVAKIGE